MKKLVFLLLVCFLFSSCFLESESKKDSLEKRRKEYPFVMVSFKPSYSDQRDNDGDKIFSVYRCKHCDGEKDDLTIQEEQLNKIQDNLFVIFRSNKMTRREK